MTRPTLHDIYNHLLEHLGPQGWWPGDSPWEVACGAILTQNTNWSNVETAIANLFEADVMNPAVIASMEPTSLAQLIRPAGYFNLKANRLINLAQWWIARDAPDGVRDVPTTHLRNDILGVNGVGEETADSILLYAFNRATFVVDAYTKRFASRHGWIDENAGYGKVKATFEKQLPKCRETFNEYHALIVEVGKNWCRPTPKCSGCPLEPFLE